MRNVIVCLVVSALAVPVIAQRNRGVAAVGNPTPLVDLSQASAPLSSYRVEYLLRDAGMAGVQLGSITASVTAEGMAAAPWSDVGWLQAQRWNGSALVVGVYRIRSMTHFCLMDSFTLAPGAGITTTIPIDLTRYQLTDEIGFECWPAYSIDLKLTYATLTGHFKMIPTSSTIPVHSFGPENNCN